MPFDSPENARCLVVMYHYVHDDADTLGPEPLGSHAGVRGRSTRDFCVQLDQLCARCEPIDWPRLYAWSQGQASLPPRCFLLTFDDGLANHARQVAPELETRGLCGTFFVPGRVLTTPKLLPAHAIHVLLSRLGDEAFEHELWAEIAGADYGSRWIETLDGPDPLPNPRKQSMYHYESPARGRLKYGLTMRLPIDLRNRVVDALFQRHIGDPIEWGARWYLKKDELLDLRSRGHTIGGHGYSHEPYARLSHSAQEEDLVRCAQTLSDVLGAGVRPFSYPYGSFNEGTSEICRRVGFAQAFTTESRWCMDNDDVMLCPRVDTIHVRQHLQSELPCAPR